MDNRNLPIRPDELEGLFAPLPAHMPCALAVSGGSDSTALMVLFADWLRQKGMEPAGHTVVCVDHGLRLESAAEAWKVRELAVSLGYRYDTLVIMWAGRKPQTGIQAAARERRYRLIGDYMRRHSIALLLTGHTRDDQAETLIMHLARGSGLDGLSAMAPIAPLGDTSPGEPAACSVRRIARPLLDVSKARLRATLEARGIAWIEDPSNAAPEFERSRLREARAQLDAVGLTDGMLALSAARLLRARRALDRIVDGFCAAEAGAVGVDPCGVVTIDRARLRRAGEEVALRVLNRAIAAAGGSGEPVPLTRLEAIAASICGGGLPGRWTLARALVTAGEATIAVERERGREPLPELVVAPGSNVLWDGRFRVSIGTNFSGGPVQVRALGAAALRDLRRRGAVATGIPARAAGLVPSVWHEGQLIAAPPLQYWTAPHGRSGVAATFVGLRARCSPDRPDERKLP